MPDFKLPPASLRHLIVPLLLLSFAGAADDRCQNLSSDYTNSQTQLWQDLLALSDEAMQGRKSGTAGAERARAYITSRYREAGLIPLPVLSDADPSSDGSPWLHRFKMPGLFSQKEGRNVVGFIPGKMFPQHHIVITAHYDHLGKKGRNIYYGANDNATGVAAMFYLAKYLVHSGPEHSFVFLATDYEEDGLYGAKAFVEEGIIAHDNIRLNINLDMIGQPGRDWMLYTVGTRWQPDLKPVINDVIDTAPVCMQMGLDKPTRSYDRRHRIDWRKASDHWAFAQESIPWLFFGVKDYKYYHSPRDTADRLSQPFYTGVVDTILMAVQALDQHYAQPD